jgi:hypothetical protein
MANCKWCEQPFLPVKDWQVFCCERYCQDWHLHQRKLVRQEKLFDKLRKRDEVLARLNKEELAQLVENSKGTAEQRRQAGETLDEHRAKWKAIREGWAEEDRQEAQERPRFLRRF